MKLFVALLLALPLAAADNWRDQGVLYLDHSPQAVLHPVPVRAVRLGAGFWQDRRRVNVDRSLPTMLELLEQHGIVDNFRRLTGRSKAGRQGPLYTDSDLYKWIEAAAFVLQSDANPQLQATVDRLIGEVAAAQEPSGYINTYYVGDRAALRFTEMQRSHELYCLGHLIQAGVAYYRATGNRSLMDVGIRFADYLVENFGPSKRPLLTGHPELELALAELYRTTGTRSYLDLAGYLLSGVERERLHLKESDIRYMFSGVPFTSRTVFEGHAVRAMYASSGAADYYAETGDPAYRQTLETLWRDLSTRKMYITGGVGSRAQGEAFGESYELPNAQAYTESCAAIGNMMWNFRLLSITGEARFADILERALYNGVNSGMSLSGTLYCYRNPLASNGEKIRNEWYDTTCCPPNIQRILASLPGYFYSTQRDGLAVNLYHNSVLDWHLEDGTPLKLEQKTDYPWNGNLDLKMTPSKPVEFTLYLRIPAWSRKTGVIVNGIAEAGGQPGQYLALRRRWKAGDRVQLRLEMAPRLTAANPRVAENAGKIAVERGPLVYCLEELDQRGPVSDLAIAKPEEGFESAFRDDLLGGVLTLQHAGWLYQKPLAGEPLYERMEIAQRRLRKPAALTLIPYYGWANREPAAMTVWLPKE
ncbi:MAG: glycoside hydrolase family 127 protein [Acidobacteriota bacterium]|nr:glycoside hydrolase family 127 protein [Acidobacteriota bacterium]